MEEIRDEDTVNFHNMIFDNPGLLHLLERGTVTNMPDRLFSDTLRWTPYFKKFQEFVSPFLIASVSKGISQSIQKNDFETASKFLQAKDLIVDEDFDKTFGKVKHGIKSIIHEVERTTKKEIVFNSAHFDFINHPFVGFMNELPEGLAGLREDMATALVDLSVPYQRSHKEFCHYLYLYLQYLNCSEGLKELIISNAAIIRNSSNSVKQESSSSAGGVWVFIFIFFIVVAVFRFNSDSSSGKSNYTQSKRLEIPYMSKSESGHFFLQWELRAIASRQLTSVGADSIKKIVSTHPSGFSYADRPYANHYLSLKNYKPSSGSIVQLKNLSGYDVIVFVRNDANAFSSFLFQKDTMSIHLKKSDRLSFYVGNDWISSVKFKSKGFDKSKTMNGIFMNVDSTTVNYLNKYYVFDCSSSEECGTVDIVLGSTDESGFVVEVDKQSLFTQKSGLYFNNIK